MRRQRVMKGLLRGLRPSDHSYAAPPVIGTPPPSSPNLVGTVSRMEADAYDLYRSAERLLEDREAPAAVPLLEQAARQLPDERAILRLLALAHYGSASFTAAESLLRRLVDADPVDADSLHMLGKTLELTGRPEQAQQYYAQSRRSSITPWPDNSSLHTR